MFWIHFTSHQEFKAMYILSYLIQVKSQNVVAHTMLKQMWRRWDPFLPLVRKKRDALEKITGHCVVYIPEPRRSKETFVQQSPLNLRRVKSSYRSKTALVGSNPIRDADPIVYIRSIYFSLYGSSWRSDSRIIESTNF